MNVQPREITANISFLKGAYDGLVQSLELNEDSGAAIDDVQNVQGALIYWTNCLVDHLDTLLAVSLEYQDVPDSSLLPSYFNEAARDKIALCVNGMIDPNQTYEVDEPGLCDELQANSVQMSDDDIHAISLATVLDLFDLKKYLDSGSSLSQWTGRISASRTIPSEHPVALALSHLTKLFLLKPLMSNYVYEMKDLGKAFVLNDEGVYADDTEMKVRQEFDLNQSIRQSSIESLTRIDRSVAEFAYDELEPKHLNQGIQMPHLGILQHSVALPKRFSAKLIEAYKQKGLDPKAKTMLGFALGSLPAINFDKKIFKRAREVLQNTNDWRDKFIAARLLTKIEFPDSCLEDPKIQKQGRVLFDHLVKNEIDPDNLARLEQDCAFNTASVFYICQALPKFIFIKKSMLYRFMNRVQLLPKIMNPERLLLANLTEPNRKALFDHLLEDLDKPEREDQVLIILNRIVKANDVETLLSILRDKPKSEALLMLCAHACSKYQYPIPDDIFFVMKRFQDKQMRLVAQADNNKNSSEFDLQKSFRAISNLFMMGSFAADDLVGIAERHRRKGFAMHAMLALASLDYRVIQPIITHIEEYHKAQEDYCKFPKMGNFLSVLGVHLRDPQLQLEDDIDFAFARGEYIKDYNYSVKLLSQDPLPDSQLESVIRFFCDVYAGTKDKKLQAQVREIIRNAKEAVTPILYKFAQGDLLSPRAIAARVLITSSSFQKRPSPFRQRAQAAPVIN